MKPALQTLQFWIVTVAAIAVAALTGSLGDWQLRRAGQKLALQAAISSKNKLEAHDSRALAAIKNIADEVHRRVALQGTWVPAQTVYLDNRTMNGKSGFWVLTPLMLAATDRAVIVQRGWVPRNFNDRSSVPPVDTPAGLVQVEGRIALQPGRLFDLGGAGQGRIRQNLDIAAFRSETGLPLLEATVVQIDPSVPAGSTGPSAGGGLLRDWAAPTTGVDKHNGYAFQWFGLCALVVGLYGWFQLRPLFRRQLNS